MAIKLWIHQCIGEGKALVIQLFPQALPLNAATLGTSLQHVSFREAVKIQGRNDTLLFLWSLLLLIHKDFTFPLVDIWRHPVLPASSVDGMSVPDV